MSPKKRAVKQLIPKERKKKEAFWTRLSSSFYSFTSRLSFLDYNIIVRRLKHKLNLVMMSQATWRMIRFVSLAVFVMIAIMILILSSNSFSFSLSLMIFLMFLAIGYILPEIYLMDKLSLRQYIIYTELPDFFDLLNLYVNSAAYENFPKCIREVSDSMQGILAKDLQYVAQMSHLLTLEELLNMIKKRLSDPLVSELVVSVRLNRAYGGSLGRKVSILAKEAHKSRLRRAKQSGIKAAGALLIPLVFFYLPVLLIIILAPSIAGLTI